ncbi:plasmid mobilization relaxosome protein MobC [Oceaniradius stylonematis]|jgi:uncharacterized protein (DUF1778 family)|uniref:plasmid mobilization protein n=1 Tax=Oceaniradius stylonematis TaxID=2184161 RepID=UPI0035D135F7
MSENKAYPYPSPVSVRFTPEERELLERAARGRSLSAFIRDQVLAENATRRKNRNRMPVENEQELARVLGMLGQSRIANNLNQLAKDANCGVLVMDPETRQQIEEAYAHVKSMRDSLVRALGLLEERSQ